MSGSVRSKGKEILGLASGGGQQMPTFAACGAICTVLDYSPLRLESERMVAKEGRVMTSGSFGEI